MTSSQQIACVCLIALAQPLFAQRMQLDDERINGRWQDAREYKLNAIVYQGGTFQDTRFEVGLPGFQHTLSGMEFPWKNPGGRQTNKLTRSFVWPRDVKPLRINNITYPNPTTFSGKKTRPNWVWPEGTTFFELHFHGKGHAFALRVLEKASNERGFESYEPHIFRPFRDESDLPFRVSQKIVKEMTVHSGHERKAFSAKGVVSFYPDVNADWSKLVNKVWEDDLGHEWHHAGEGHGWLTPKNYTGWMVGSGESCNDCHDTAGQPVEYFDRPGRDWYGFIRGSDGIFSFDPVDRRSVTANGQRHPGGFKWKLN